MDVRAIQRGNPLAAQTLDGRARELVALVFDFGDLRFYFADLLRLFEQLSK